MEPRFQAPDGARPACDHAATSCARTAGMSELPDSGEADEPGQFCAGPVDDAGMRLQHLRRRLLASVAPRGGNRTAERPPWYGQRVASEPGFVLSPGGWTPPAGVLPGWSWVPPDGA
jgi:hypothetical protein